MSVVADQPQLDHRVGTRRGRSGRLPGLAATHDPDLFLRLRGRSGRADNGILWDRFGIARAVAIFLVCAFIGTPVGQWGVLAIDWSLYCAMWFAYETTRGAARRHGYSGSSSRCR